MIKRTLSFMAVLALFAVISCKKDSPTVIRVNVTNSGQAASGVSVKLLSDDHRTTADYVASGTSNSSGTIDFTVTPGKVYYLYSSGSYLITNADATFIFNGKFTTQQQIADSPVQTPPAQIGDNIDVDINGDGAINTSDKVIAVTAPSQGNTLSANLSVSAINN